MASEEVKAYLAECERRLKEYIKSHPQQPIIEPLTGISIRHELGVDYDFTLKYTGDSA